jgi:hypothetical protein
MINSPNPPGDQRSSSLNNIVCLNGTDCWVVGASHNGVVYETLVEENTGGAWTIIPSPNSSVTEDNVLNGVTCTTQTDCWAVGTHSPSTGVAQTLVEHYTTVPVQLNAVTSRMTHSAAGTFDVDLTNGDGIECRSGASGDYMLVFTFASALTSVGGANVASGTASITSSSISSDDGHSYLVNLTGVANAQRLTITLNNVTDSVGDFSSSVSSTMGVLIADVNASGRVDAADVSAVRQQTLQTINDLNFRHDINASGRIDAADVSIARQQTLTSLP